MRTKLEKGTFIYVCPVDKTYSGRMDLIRVNKTYTVDELCKLQGNKHLAGERLRCPECKKIYGWHQLEKVKLSKDLLIVSLGELRSRGQRFGYEISGMISVLKKLKNATKKRKK